MHGLIQEVQRISESHKTLMNEKSDIKLRLDNFEDSLNRNIVGIPTVRMFICYFKNLKCIFKPLI